jgi:hypothetical protein
VWNAAQRTRMAIHRVIAPRETNGGVYLPIASHSSSR